MDLIPEDCQIKNLLQLMADTEDDGTTVFYGDTENGKREWDKLMKKNKARDKT